MLILVTFVFLKGFYTFPSVNLNELDYFCTFYITFTILELFYIFCIVNWLAVRVKSGILTMLCHWQNISPMFLYSIYTFLNCLFLPINVYTYTYILTYNNIYIYQYICMYVYIYIYIYRVIWQTSSRANVFFVTGKHCVILGNNLIFNNNLRLVVGIARSR